MIVDCYGGTTSANVSWQASQLQESAIADRAHQIGMTDHTRWAHAAQQGKKKLNHKNSTAFVFVGIACEEKKICSSDGGKNQIENANKWSCAMSHILSSGFANCYKSVCNIHD